MLELAEGDGRRIELNQWNYFEIGYYEEGSPIPGKFVEYRFG